ncbi:hypothetical protein H6768_04720 [Candidatus Peribacteria bacterium]|nr:hypothetical protein [Candidatus Peribacteria bacterium]
MALRTAQVLQKQGHSVTFYTFERDNACFPDLQKGLTIKVWPPNGPSEEKNTQNKLINIVSLAWHLRHVDTIIANNPPMQIVAALVKIFVPRIQTIWWHHHVPWYITT